MPQDQQKPANGSAPVVESVGIDHLYEGHTGWVHALQNFCLSVPKNQFLCLLGPSGCGKSTFLKIVSGLIEPLNGQVLINGEPVTGPGLDRGIVFQDPALFPWLTVIKNVEFGLKMAGWNAKAARERAMHVLQIVGLTNSAQLYPYQLSGGMKHRVAVARAWALTKADLLLMDEPFSAIDAINRMTLQDYLVETWLEERRTVLYVTHDIDEAVYLADRVILLSPAPGRIISEFLIEMPRPRDHNSTEATDYRHRITEAMHASLSTGRAS
jgi:NitT/TauT family transport system ATP-binding protein